MKLEIYLSFWIQVLNYKVLLKKCIYRIGSYCSDGLFQKYFLIFLYFLFKDLLQIYENKIFSIMYTSAENNEVSLFVILCFLWCYERNTLLGGHMCLLKMINHCVHIFRHNILSFLIR